MIQDFRGFWDEIQPERPAFSIDPETGEAVYSVGLKIVGVLKRGGNQYYRWTDYDVEIDGTERRRMRFAWPRGAL